MPAAIFNIDFEQGIPRDLTVSDWRDKDGNLFVLDGCKSRAQFFADADDPTPLLDLSTENGKIEILNGRITLHFDETDTGKMTPVDGAAPIAPVIECAKKYKAGVWEWRIWNTQNVPFAMARGEYNITPALLREVTP
ncbi:hypothetical protein [Paraburkholderia sp. C35]|uniref:hypothetical protein n=1 Tax=Paraburkholderia sp. C35 TaxID=2126993 RepID=UPI000D68C784|nr:hypothetical protein [Paraburkholderia sp. C35]